MKQKIYISKDEGRAVSFFELTMRHDFIEAIEKSRKKLGININHLYTGDIKDIRWLDLMNDKKLNKTVSSLVSKLEISSGWEDVIARYLVDGTYYSPGDKNPTIINNPNGLILNIDTDDTEKFVLEVGPDTLFEDIENGWDEILRYRKKSVGRKKERPDFLRDVSIFFLAQQGKTISEICAIIESSYKTKELSYGNIKKIVSSFYEQCKIPKEKRLKLKTGKVTPKNRLRGNE